MINTVKWSFAVGHVFNDLCASMWFLFSLPYFTKVIDLPNPVAGNILLIGQVADAIATPLIGIESDRIGCFIFKFIGQRKSWHLFGSILCAFSFPFIFNSFFNHDKVENYYLVVYYTPFVVVFQFAWAIVQITHLSLIPILMNLGQNNSSLNSLRYMFTVASNIIVLAATTVLFNLHQKSPMIKNDTSIIVPSDYSINSSDQKTFTYLTIGVVIVGLCFTLLFHLGVPEKSQKTNLDVNENYSESNESSSLLQSSTEQMRKVDWFKEPQFYLINLLYLATRLIVNISQLYLVLYVVDTLGQSKIISSLAALTTFISGAISSIILKKVQEKIGKKICYLIGLIFIMSFCIIVAFSNKSTSLWQIYLSMVFLGMGCSMIMVGSLSLTAELIGKGCNSSAFVYGAMSFSDKMFCGIVIWLLQFFGPSDPKCSQCLAFYYIIELFFIGGCCVIAFILLLILYPMKIGNRWKDRQIKINGSSSSFEGLNT